MCRIKPFVMTDVLQAYKYWHRLTGLRLAHFCRFHSSHTDPHGSRLYSVFVNLTMLVEQHWLHSVEPFLKESPIQIKAANVGIFKTFQSWALELQQASSITEGSLCMKLLRPLSLLNLQVLVTWIMWTHLVNFRYIHHRQHQSTAQNSFASDLYP